MRKKNIAPHLDVSDHEEGCHSEEEEEELADGVELHHLQPVFGSTRSEPSSELAHLDEVLCQLCQTLEKVVLQFFLASW